MKTEFYMKGHMTLNELTLLDVDEVVRMEM